MPKRSLLHTGEWKPVIEWLDELSGGRMIVPFGHRPPIIRDAEDGSLRVTNSERTEICQIGDHVVFDGREFHVMTKELIASIKETDNVRPAISSTYRPNPNNARGARGNGRKHRSGKR